MVEAQRVTLGVVIASWLLIPGVVLAQNTGIAGVVRDSSGAVIPGVTVEASSPALIEKVRSVVTDAQGLYQIVDLRPGVYTVTFSLPGFTSVQRAGIELSASFTATVNAELNVGAVAETVTVSGQTPTVDVRNVVQQRVLTDEVRQALPTARSFQTMAQTIPGMAVVSTNRPSGQDVGGLSGERGRVLIHGSRDNDMTIQLDGLSWNLAVANGAAQGFTLDPAEAQEFVYELGAISAETMSGGVRANIIPKEGGNRFSAYFLGSYINGDFQSDNLTDDLKARGLQTVNKVVKLYDVNPAFGGPLKQDKLWFYASFRYWGEQDQVAGLFRPIDPLAFVFNPALGAAGNVDLSRPAIEDSWLRTYGLRLTWQAHPKHKFSAYVSHQPRQQATQGILATRTYEAAMKQVVKLNRMIQTSWKSPVTNRFLVEVAWASPYTSTPEDPTVPTITPDTVSVTDTGTGILFRAAPTYWVPYYYQPSAKASVSYVTGAHAAKFGIDYGWGAVRNIDQRTNAGMTYTLQNTVPRSITLALSPRNELERYRSLGLYAQDQWTIKRLTVNAGLRFDYHNEWVPSQTSGPGPSVPFQTWPEVRDVPNWKDFSPRFGVAYDLFGSSKTAVKATLSRYVVRDQTSFAAQNNPMLFNASATRTWNDQNSDYLPQETELGSLSNRNFGTAVPTTRVDDAIRDGWGIRLSNWEMSAGIQQELLPQVSVSAAYFRRWFDNFVVTDNLAVTPLDYDQYCITAPPDARLGGVSGSQICGLYDLNPSKLGQVNNLRTAAANYGTQKETFDGIDLTMNVRLPRRIQISGGVSSGTNKSSGNVFTNSTSACFVIDSPQALRFCDLEVPWLTQVKFLGTIGLPWNIDAGATFQSSPGPEILANYTVNSTQVQGLGRNLSSGTAINSLIEPGTLFGDRLYQFDLRLAKSFRFGGVRVRGILDLANMLNASTVLLQNNTYGSNWLRPTWILPGRIIRPSVQVDF